MPRRSNGRPSRKARKQLWIGALAGSLLLSGLLFGNAIDAHFLASAAKNTRSFDEGWDSFQDHLDRLATRSGWIGLAFLVIFCFVLPRAYRVARRYFPGVKLFQGTWALALMTVLFFFGGATGFFGGFLIDRILTATDIVR